MQSGELSTGHRPSPSDIEAVDWFLHISELAHSADPQAERERIQGEFNRWATCPPENLQSYLETYAIWLALGECEAISLWLAVVGEGERELTDGGA